MQFCIDQNYSHPLAATGIALEDSGVTLVSASEAYTLHP